MPIWVIVTWELLQRTVIVHHASGLGPKRAKRLYIVVDPDVMEYVTATSLHDQLKEVLATRTSEINWKMNRRIAVLLYRGEDKSASGSSECKEEVQKWLGKLKKQNVEVNKVFLEAVKAQLPSIHARLSVEPPLVELKDYEVNIQTEKGDDDFFIWGNKEGIKRAKSKLEALADSTECETLKL